METGNPLKQLRDMLSRWRGQAGTEARRHDDRTVRPTPVIRMHAGRPDRRGGRRTGYLDPATFHAVAGGLARREAAQRLHIFSLTDFREAVGPKWARLSGLVAVALDHIIHRHVETHGFFTRLDAETACVVLPKADRRHARTRVAAIARDISAHLFGAMLVEGRRPQVMVANVGLAAAAAPPDGICRKLIGAAIAAARAAMTPPALPDMPAEAHRLTLAGLLDAEDKAAAIPVPAKQSPAWETLRIGARPQRTAGTGPQSVRPPATAVSWADAEVDRRAAADPSPHMTPDTTLTLVWSPTWVTRSASIGAFQTRVIRTDETDRSVREGVHAYAGLSPVEVLALDRFAAAQAARELNALAATGRTTGLILSLHWTSLAPRWRDCVRLPLEQVPAALRRKALKIEVFGLSPAVPASILPSLFQPMAGLGCDLLARVPLSATAMIGGLRGLRGVGLDMAELPEDERCSDAELTQRVTHFHATARAAGLASYVWGIRRPTMIERLVRTGLSLVNGPGVMSDVACPVPMGAVATQSMGNA